MRNFILIPSKSIRRRGRVHDTVANGMAATDGQQTGWHRRPGLPAWCVQRSGISDYRGGLKGASAVFGTSATRSTEGEIETDGGNISGFVAT